MATSPIYNWPEPDNTDLVKNGALAMRTLGDAIDTTMATMTPKSIVDAKGDLIAASAADTPARLAVGNNGETLVADNSTATGLRYTNGNPISNPVLNSCFDVWQRGTSITMSSTAYTADRWQGYRTVAGGTVSRQATGDTTNLPFIQYCARVQRDSGNTSTGLMLLQYTQETANSIPYSGKTITFSFYARKGANFSEANSNLELNVSSGTGTDQNGITGFTGSASVIAAQQSTLTTTWQRFSYTATVAATATQLTWGFRYTPVGTAGAADYFEVTGVQIDLGSVALPVRRYALTIQQELAACQRYYFRNTASAQYNVYYAGAARSTTLAYCWVQFPVQMRITPTSLEYSNVALWDFPENSFAISALTFVQNSNNTAFLGATTTGLTASRPYYLLANTSSSYVGFSAEL